MRTPAASSATLEQLEAYPIELRPLVQRYGIEVMNMCLIVAGTNRAIDTIIELGDRTKVGRDSSLAVLNNMTTLIQEVIRMKGWPVATITQCIDEIGLVQASPAGMPLRVVH